MTDWMVPLIGIALAFEICAAKPAKAEEKTPQKGYVRVDVQKGRFACEVPAEWAQLGNSTGDERTKVFGLLLIGPKGEGPLRPSFSLRYFSAEYRLTPTAAAFLKRQLEPGPVPLQGEKTSAVSPTKVAGLAAQTFTRDTFDYWPPRSLDTKEFPVREEYFVIQGKEGFWVLIYHAPTAHFTIWRPLFQHVLDSFRLLPPG